MSYGLTISLQALSNLYPFSATGQRGRATAESHASVAPGVIER